MFSYILLSRNPIVHWYCKDCKKYIKVSPSKDVTQDIGFLKALNTASMMGNLEVPLEGHVYKW